MVARREDLPEGSRKIVSVRGRSIGIFHQAGHYFALRNICPHHGAALCEGPVAGHMRPSAPHEYELGDTVEEQVVRCPWHGFAYRLADGQSLSDPSSRVRTFRVAVEGDDVVVYL